MREYIITIESILKIYIYMYNEKKTHLLETTNNPYLKIFVEIFRKITSFGDFKTTHIKLILI